jgi:hypothetical protein
MPLNRYGWTLALAAPLAVGCADEAPVAPVALPSAAVSPVASAAKPAAPTPVAPTPAAAAPQLADSKPNAPTPADAQPEAAAYQPPFPERVDLFVPPKRQGGVRIGQGEREDSVELLGFVRVDQPKAVLSINGLTMSLAEGGNEYGIEVISIQPPSVVLQRGRQRWQASLEN